MWADESDSEEGIEASSSVAKHAQLISKSSSFESANEDFTEESEGTDIESAINSSNERVSTASPILLRSSIANLKEATLVMKSNQSVLNSIHLDVFNFTGQQEEQRQEDEILEVEEVMRSFVKGDEIVMRELVRLKLISELKDLSKGKDGGLITFLIHEFLLKLPIVREDASKSFHSKGLLPAIKIISEIIDIEPSDSSIIVAGLVKFISAGIKVDYEIGPIIIPESKSPSALPSSPATFQVPLSPLASTNISPPTSPPAQPLPALPQSPRFRLSNLFLRSVGLTPLPPNITNISQSLTIESTSVSEPIASRVISPSLFRENLVESEEQSADGHSTGDDSESPQTAVEAGIGSESASLLDSPDEARRTSSATTASYHTKKETSIYSIPIILPPPQNLKSLNWGGFMSDLVGTRITPFGHAFLIKTEREEKLPEFVLRDRSQFEKYRDSLTIAGYKVKSLPNDEKEMDIVELYANLMEMRLKQKKLKFELERRNLRNWLRDTLSIHQIGHLRITADFLLLGSIVPNKLDKQDINIRERVDLDRNSIRAKMFESLSRPRGLKEEFEQLKHDCVNGNLNQIVDKIVGKGKSLEGSEYLRFCICQFLYDDFVSPATSATNLQILSDLHDAVPYFLIKQILNLPTSMLGTKAQKMIISNLMIKSLDILLQDEGIDAKLSDLKLRIGSFALCRKLEDFVLVASKKDRAVVTEFAKNRKLALAICIVRGSTNPISAYELDRVILAQKEQQRAITKGRITAGKNVAGLYSDLIEYLKLVEQKSFAGKIRVMLKQEETKELIKVLLVPLIILFKRTYKLCGTLFADLQKFLDNFIQLAGGLAQRRITKIKAMKSIGKLLEENVEMLTRFIRKIQGEQVFLELIKWLQTLTEFVRLKSFKSITLESLLPSSTHDKLKFMKELDHLKSYSHLKEVENYSNFYKYSSVDVEGDYPISVLGDGFGKSSSEGILEKSNSIPKPVLSEINRSIKKFSHLIS